MARVTYRLILIALLAAGCWQLGQGIYIHLKASLAQALLEQAWEKTQAGEHQVKPWSWADTWPVARMSVPRLDVKLIVLAGDSGRTLAFGPGHNFGSAAPGKTGNSYISGHRDTHFSFIRDLQNGDRVIIETSERQLKHYIVTQAFVVDANRTRLEVDEHISQISLITCYPFDSIVANSPLRYIVTAVEEEVPGATGIHSKQSQVIPDVIM